MAETSTVMRDHENDALTKLAEIPPAGSEERDFWLEAARQHGFEETSGGEQVPEYDPPAYFATADEVLKLMSEARKQGQRDALTVGIQAGIEAAIRGIDATILNIGSDCDRRGIQDPETGEVPCDGEEEAGCACSAALELGGRLIENLRSADVAKIAALASLEQPPATDRLTLHADRGETGLWYVTSPDDRGLLVAEATRDAALIAVPAALADLAKAREDAALASREAARG